MGRERPSCLCGSLQCIGPGCSSFFAWRLSVGSKGSATQNSFISLHRSSWLLLAPLLTPPVPVITAMPCSLCPEGAHRFQWIRNLVPEFGISSSHVKVLSSPAEFYELLKVSCGFQVWMFLGNKQQGWGEGLFSMVARVFWQHVVEVCSSTSETWSWLQQAAGEQTLCGLCG